MIGICANRYRLIWGIFFSVVSTAYAAPRGAVSLGSDKLFQPGAFYCGNIGNSWIPGRLIAGGLFYSRSAERANILKSARKASDAIKKRLTKKARMLLTKQRTEMPTCSSGPATPTPTPSPTPTITLSTINSSLYRTEHALFIIPSAGQVTWDGSASWDSVYSTSNINSYVSTLRSNFPSDYFFVVVTASNLLPDRVPNVLTYRQIAAGIGEDSLSDPAASNICRYNAGSSLGDGVYGVLDHEIGHNWGVFIGSALGEGHWRSNSNASGQMAENFSDDGFQTTKVIQGDPVSGFTWVALNNDTRNETEIFSDRDLYLQGLNATFPTLYVLNSPIYNPNGTVSYTSVATYDQAWVEANNGVRNPSYRTSEKRFRLGFVYVARDLAEIQSAYLSVERSIRHYIYGEEVDTTNFRYQVPFLVATRFRGSIDARLADLDGNASPELTISGPKYLTSSNGSATVPFVVSDDAGAPAVSCVPASSSCAVSANNVQLTGLSTGTHFITIKAQDSEGKAVFAHFVVDVS